MAKKKKQKKETAPDVETIVTGHNDPAHEGYIGKKLENPDEVLAKESEGRGIAVYDQLGRDPHIFCEMQKRVFAVTSKEWEVIPATDKSQDTKVADFVKDVLGSFAYDKACKNLLYGNVKGFSMGETLWEMSEGDVSIKDITYVPQRRIIFGVEGNPRLLTKSAPEEGEALLLNKFTMITWGAEAETAYGNPLGNKLYWPWWFKKHGIKDWLVFQERFAQPTPHGKYPAGTLKPDQDKLLGALQAIQTNSEIVTPEGMLIEFLEASRTGRAQYEGFAEFMNGEMSKTILGGTLTTSAGDKGARALGEVHERVMDFIVKADSDDLCAHMNRQVIKQLVDYNFPDIKKYPEVWRRLEKEKDLKVLAERDALLVEKVGLPIAVRYFYDTYGIPEPEAGETLVAAPVPDPGQKEPVLTQEFAESSGGQPDQQMAERLETEGSMDAMLDAIRTLADNASSLGDLKKKVKELGPESADVFAGMLEKGLIAANLTGRLEEAL